MRIWGRKLMLVPPLTSWLMWSPYFFGAKRAAAHLRVSTRKRATLQFSCVAYGAANRGKRPLLSWSGWRQLRGRPTPRFRTIQVCPKDLASAVRQSDRAANRPNGPVGALIGIGEEVPHARHEAARVHCSGRCG